MPSPERREISEEIRRKDEPAPLAAKPRPTTVLITQAKTEILTITRSFYLSFAFLTGASVVLSHVIGMAVSGMSVAAAFAAMSVAGVACSVPAVEIVSAVPAIMPAMRHAAVVKAAASAMSAVETICAAYAAIAEMRRTALAFVGIVMAGVNALPREGGRCETESRGQYRQYKELHRRLRSLRVRANSRRNPPQIKPALWPLSRDRQHGA